VVLELSGVAGWTEYHIPVDLNLQQHSCVHRRNGLRNADWNMALLIYNYSENVENDAG
jgi:hypothetical protein